MDLKIGGSIPAARDSRLDELMKRQVDSQKKELLQEYLRRGSGPVTEIVKTLPAEVQAIYDKLSPEEKQRLNTMSVNRQQDDMRTAMNDAMKNVINRM